MTARRLPYQHLSVRVPWHDNGWEGSICADPLANGACLRLGRIAEGRNDSREMSLAGKTWADIAEADLPPCSVERAGFMSPDARRVTKRHPYAAWNEVYRKFQPTSYEVPAYSANCVPFRWMLRKSISCRTSQNSKQRSTLRRHCTIPAGCSMRRTSNCSLTHSSPQLSRNAASALSMPRSRS